MGVNEKEIFIQKLLKTDTSDWVTPETNKHNEYWLQLRGLVKIRVVKSRPRPTNEAQREEPTYSIYVEPISVKLHSGWTAQQLFERVNKAFTQVESDRNEKFLNDLYTML